MKYNIFSELSIFIFLFTITIFWEFQYLWDERDSPTSLTPSNCDTGTKGTKRKKVLGEKGFKGKKYFE